MSTFAIKIIAGIMLVLAGLGMQYDTANPTKSASLPAFMPGLGKVMVFAGIYLVARTMMRRGKTDQ